MVVSKTKKRLIKCLVPLVAIWFISSISWNIYELYFSLECSGKLKGVYSHFPGYRQGNNGENPSSLDVLIEQSELLKKDHLYCPIWYLSDFDRKYVYRGDDLNAGSPGHMILIYERTNVHPDTKHLGLIRKVGGLLFFGINVPRGRMVVFSDGSVELLGTQEFSSAFFQDIQLRKKMGLETRDSQPFL